MTLASVCPLLSLPQELRDVIYEFTLNTGGSINEDGLQPSTSSTYRSAGWALHFPKQAPQATYFRLMLCCRQLHSEVAALLRQTCQNDGSAKLQLDASYPDMRVDWTHLPTPPSLIKELDISIKVSNMFDPGLDNLEYEDVLFRPVFDILKRYIHSGPHLARSRALPRPLELHTVRVTVGSATPIEEMTYVFASPAFTLYMMYGRCNSLLERLAHSGMLFGVINSVETRLEGEGEEWQVLSASSDQYVEEDRVFLADTGFRWGPD